MNLDIGTIVLIGIIVVAVYLLYKRLMPQQSPYSQQGSNRPQYDDPNISSHGGFGGNGRSDLSHLSQGQSKPVVEAPRRTVSEKAPESPRPNDDPNINSRGGFGG